MDQPPGLASEIGRQAEAEMKDFRDHTVERIELPPLLLIEQTDSASCFKPATQASYSGIPDLTRQLPYRALSGSQAPNRHRQRRVPGAPGARLRWMFRLLF
jgi:hypothetical protein